MKPIALVLFTTALAAPAAALELSAPVNTCAIIQELGADLERIGGIDYRPSCFDIRFSLPAQTQTRTYQVGAYFPDHDTIALARDIDIRTVFGKSVLLHEMVHMAQHRRADMPDCIATLESEAYFVQGLYLSENGAQEDAVMTHLMGGLMGQCGGPDY